MTCESFLQYDECQGFEPVGTSYRAKIGILTSNNFPPCIRHAQPMDTN